MSKSGFPASIKSRPVYGGLTYRPGAFHLVVADGEGAEAVVDLLKAAPEPAGMLAAMHILYTPGPEGVDRTGLLQDLGAAQFFRAPTIPTLLPRLARVLQDLRMGTQFYVAGSEGLMGQVERDIMATGFPFGAIQKEHRGSTVRRVQCVHCKGITENVATDPFQCSHCGLHLFVRDHYSRRIAAFQGVCIDAEDPGQNSPIGGEVPMSGGAKLQVRVAEVVVVNDLVKRFRLVSRDGGLLPAFSGGAHIVVEMDDHGTRRLNPYSIMSAPEDRRAYEISVRRDDAGRGGSLFLHAHVRAGMELSISYPVNLFALDQRARKHLMIAGGIGITPFLAQISQLAHPWRQVRIATIRRETQRLAPIWTGLPPPMDPRSIAILMIKNR